MTGDRGHCAKTRTDHYCPTACDEFTGAHIYIKLTRLLRSSLTFRATLSPEERLLLTAVEQLAATPGGIASRTQKKKPRDSRSDEARHPKITWREWLIGPPNQQAGKVTQPDRGLQEGVQHPMTSHRRNCGHLTRLKPREFFNAGGVSPTAFVREPIPTLATRLKPQASTGPRGRQRPPHSRRPRSSSTTGQKKKPPAEKCIHMALEAG